MSDIGLHWNAIELALIVLLATSPGLLAGLLFGAVAWRAHRIRGAALGAFAGLALGAALLFICFNSRIAQADGLGGATMLALKIGLPGGVLGGMIAAWRFHQRWIVAAIGGAALGFVVWLGGWAYLS